MTLYEFQGIAMQFKALEAGIEINAPTVSAIISGLGPFTNISRRYLRQVGIGKVDDGHLVLDATAWFPQEAWLKAFENIAAQVGEAALYNIGLSIPKTAFFPDWVKDIYTSIRAIDVAFHMNHRKGGKPLYDFATGTMLEGIGHYGCQALPDMNRIVSLCDSPYPCDFDRGILTAMARRFEPLAEVSHESPGPCRKNGEDSCTYYINW
jgi:hypothetical protein